MSSSALIRAARGVRAEGPRSIVCFSTKVQPKGEKDMLHGDTTDKVIHAFFRVHRSLGLAAHETSPSGAQLKRTQRVRRRCEFMNAVAGLKTPGRSAMGRPVAG